MSGVIPSTYKLIGVLFSIMHELGGKATNDEIYAAVVRHLDLKHVAVSHLKDRDRDTLAYRLSWARTQLKAHGLMDNPSPALWRLTAKGKALEEINSATVSGPATGERQVNVRLSPEAIIKLENICQTLQVSKSAFVESIILTFNEDTPKPNN